MEYQSVNKLLQKSFSENWNRPALSNYKGLTLSYGDVARRIALLHLCFEACGLHKGDKVAICGRNQSGWAVAFLASLTYGAVPVPILHEFKPENVQYLVNHSDARALFIDEANWDGMSEVDLPEVQVIVQMSKYRYIYTRDQSLAVSRETIFNRYRTLYPGGYGPSNIDWHEDKPDEIALINYTSGTSGFSKGVMLPYRSLLCNLRFARYTAEPQMTNESKMVAMLPSAHMYGMMFELLFEMTIGAHVQFLGRLPSPNIIMKAFADVKPDVVIAVPLILEKIYKMQVKPIADRNKTLLAIPILDLIVQAKIREGLVNAFGGRFEEIILGGAPFSPEVEEFLRRIRFPFTVGYGMTECGPLITYAHWNRTRKGSCGMAITGCSIRIDSPDPERVSGEVQVKGDNVFLGYYKNEKATRDSFTSDGWFKTGDMGVVDSAGYLYLRGRSKCMILGPSGQNIYPEELEAVINSVSYVADSLVIEDNGALTALVYPDYRLAQKDGLDAESVKQRLNAALPEINKVLPGYARIRKMEFLPEDFERTPKRSIKRYLYQR